LLLRPCRIAALPRTPTAPDWIDIIATSIPYHSRALSKRSLMPLIKRLVGQVLTSCPAGTRRRAGLRRMRHDVHTMATGKQVKRVPLLVIGGVVLLIGVALLVLPGPGLLLVFAGLWMLALEFPALGRYVNPVRDWAMKAAQDSVSSPLRIAGSVLCGLALIAAGILWGLRVFPWLPFPGWSTGSSLILSGILLWGLLGWSYRKVTARRR
jgi:Putative transmembrane protein (PGPGW)